MKINLFLFLLFFPFLLKGFSPSNPELRNSYHKACLSENYASLLYKQISLTRTNDPLINGYKGAIIALQAKYRLNPFSKWKNCKDGLCLLNNSIATRPTDLELRYLRLITESNIPSILNMNEHISEDKNTILVLYHSSNDPELKKMIGDFMLGSKICDDAEKAKFSTLK